MEILSIYTSILFVLKNNLYHSKLVVYLGFLISAVVFQSFALAEISDSRLWKIDKSGLKSSYIMATMHSEDPRVLKLPNNYKKIFEASKSFTAEVDLSQNISSVLIKKMMLSNTKLVNIIEKKLYQQSVIILKEFGVPEKLVNQMKPWAVLMTLSYPKQKTGLYLDKLLFNSAIKMGKKYYGLETIEEQIAVFDNVSLSEQTILLRDSIKQYPEFDHQLEQMTKLYLIGDLDGLIKFNKKILLRGNYRIANKFMKTLITTRNLRMTERMIPRLLEGQAFIAVGALHLPGDNGILQLLRNKNYQLTAIK